MEKKERAERAARPKGWGFCWLLLGLPLGGGLLLAASGSGAFAEWYARRVYPVPARALNAVTALLPFSLMEVGGLALAAVVPALLVRFFVRLCRLEKGRRLKYVARALLHLLCAASVVLLCFAVLCGVNYHRDSFAVCSGLTVEPSSLADLEGLCGELARQANTLSRAVAVRDADGVAVLTDVGWQTLADEVDAAYVRAAADCAVLGGGYAHAKPMLFSPLMSRLQLTGIFCPFTMEANVNADAPSYNIPFTMAHELAHLRGFMREDEANYIAYYVCIRSDDARLSYSGTLLALVHAGNALAAKDPTAYAQLVQSYRPAVRADLAQNNRYWAQFDDKTLSKVSNSVNDTYLKANGQADGVQSYGRMVDLLLAEWKARQNKAA